MSMPRKWTTNPDAWDDGKVINPVYVDRVESFAKRAAEALLGVNKELELEFICFFCGAGKTKKEETHTPDCIVLAAQEYLKVK